MDPVALANDYGLAAVAAGTLVDHTGVPVFIVAAGILCAANLADPVTAFIVVLAAIELTDLAMILAGRWIAGTPPVSGLAAGVIRSATAAGAGFVRAHPVLTVLGSKWVPAAGKYAPLFVAYADPASPGRWMLLFLPGNMLYAAAWLAAGFHAGQAVIRESGTVAAAIGIACILVVVSGNVLFRRHAGRGRTREVAPQWCFSGNRTVDPVAGCSGDDITTVDETGKEEMK